MTFIENSVTIKEIATVTKRNVVEVEGECAELGMHVGVDWCGRPAVAEVDAQQLVTGEARRVREHDARWSAHLRDCEDWTRRRDEAVRAGHERVGADPRQGPEKHSQAREAAIGAGREFELTTPVPLWEGVECGNCVRQYSERDAKPAGLLDKARDLFAAGAPR